MAYGFPSNLHCSGSRSYSDGIGIHHFCVGRTGAKPGLADDSHQDAGRSSDEGRKRQAHADVDVRDANTDSWDGNGHARRHSYGATVAANAARERFSGSIPGGLDGSRYLVDLDRLVCAPQGWLTQ
jgi:hypothetical protein